jgi:hypothetical protein
MSEAFAKYNQHGLELSSFVKYAPKLMKLAAERVPSKSKPSGGMMTWEEFEAKIAAKEKHKAAKNEVKVEVLEKVPPGTPGPLVTIPAALRNTSELNRDSKVRWIKSQSPPGSVFVWDDADGIPPNAFGWGL